MAYTLQQGRAGGPPEPGRPGAAHPEQPSHLLLLPQPLLLVVLLLELLPAKLLKVLHHGLQLRHVQRVVLPVRTIRLQGPGGSSALGGRAVLERRWAVGR
jgi:hypothetical protein